MIENEESNETKHSTSEAEDKGRTGEKLLTSPSRNSPCPSSPSRAQDSGQMVIMQVWDLYSK